MLIRWIVMEKEQRKPSKTNLAMLRGQKARPDCTILDPNDRRRLRRRHCWPKSKIQSFWDWWDKTWPFWLLSVGCTYRFIQIMLNLCWRSKYQTLKRWWRQRLRSEQTSWRNLNLKWFYSRWTVKHVRNPEQQGHGLDEIFSSGGWYWEISALL